VSQLDALTQRYIKATSEWCESNRKCAETTASTLETTKTHRERRSTRARLERSNIAIQIADAVARDFAERMNGVASGLDALRKHAKGNA
jgi:ribosomal protein L17